MKQFFALLCVWLAVIAAGSVARAAEPRCPPADLKSLQSLSSQVQEQIQLVDYAAALSTLEKAELLLPCVAEIVPAQQLARLYVYRGLTMFYLGNADVARISFLRALAIDRDLKWDYKLGSRAGEAFHEAREESLSRPSQALRCPLLAPGVQVFLNGRELSQGEMTSLPPGMHFLQIRWADGHWEGSLFELTAGREIPLPVPRQAMLAETVPEPVAAKPAATEPTAEAPAVRPVPPLEEPAPTDPPKVANRASYAPAIIAATIGAAGFVSYAYFGRKYLTTKRELLSGQYYSDREDTKKDDLLEANANALTRAYLSVAVGVVAAGSSALLFVRTARHNHALETTTLWIPWVAPDGAGLIVQREF